MIKNNFHPRKRTHAFSQFKQAQKMIAEGRAELVSAQQKIERAQILINLSAEAIRTTWSASRSSRLTKK